MFDNIKGFLIKLKTCEYHLKNNIFKYFPNLQKYMTDLEVHDKPDIQNLLMHELDLRHPDVLPVKKQKIK